MYQGSCSIVTVKELTYCQYLSQLIKARTSYSPNMSIHLQLLVDDNTQVDVACFKDNPWKTLEKCTSVNLLHFIADPDIYCVLLGFSFKRFDDIQSLISVMVFSSSVRTCIASLVLQCRYTYRCVISILQHR